jgi:hypothetical protein
LDSAVNIKEKGRSGEKRPAKNLPNKQLLMQSPARACPTKKAPPENQVRDRTDLEPTIMTHPIYHGSIDTFEADLLERIPWTNLTMPPCNKTSQEKTWMNWVRSQYSIISVASRDSNEAQSMVQLRWT